MEPGSQGDSDSGATETGNRLAVRGKLYTWGLGKSGQLGTGKDQTEHTPQPIAFPSGVTITQVCCGGLYTAVLTHNGDVFASGCGKYGRLGRGDNQEDTASFVKVTLPEKVKQISCGLWHGAAVTITGGVLVWGHRKGCGKPDNSSTITSPTLLISPTERKMVGVSCGHNYTLAWSEEGEVLSWGSGHSGVLGHGNTDDITTPTVVKALKDQVITQASAGYAHSAFVTDTGKVFVCGKGKEGALGLGKGQLKDVTSPEVVTFPEGVKVVQMSCSVGEHHGHSLALTSEGLVYAWGDGYKGKLGQNTQDSVFTPTLIPSACFQGEPVSNVCCGGIHSTAATAPGSVFTWGCGSDGRMGHPEGQGHRYLFRSDVPKKVEAFAQLKGKQAMVSCSYYHTAAVLA